MWVNILLISLCTPIQKLHTLWRGGGGSKMAKMLHTYYMDSPLPALTSSCICFYKQRFSMFFLCFFYFKCRFCNFTYFNALHRNSGELFDILT